MGFHKALLRLFGKTLQIEPEFKKFLNDNFKLIEQNGEDTIRIYSSPNYKLRIVQDNNRSRFIDVSTNDKPDDWFYLDVLRSYILNNDDYITSESDSFKTLFKFLSENEEKVQFALNKDNYTQTEAGYERMLRKRSDERFGRVEN